MIGALIAEYVLSQLKKSDKLPEKPALVKTIVSSNITDVIADNYNAESMEVLTGFKYIGEKIKKFEETGSNDFVFGYEESYGYLWNTFQG